MSGWQQDPRAGPRATRGKRAARAPAGADPYMGGGSPAMMDYMPQNPREAYAPPGGQEGAMMYMVPNSQLQAARDLPPDIAPSPLTHARRTGRGPPAAPGGMPMGAMAMGGMGMDEMEQAPYGRGAAAEPMAGMEPTGQRMMVPPGPLASAAPGAPAGNPGSIFVVAMELNRGHRRRLPTRMRPMPQRAEFRNNAVVNAVEIGVPASMDDDGALLVHTLPSNPGPGVIRTCTNRHEYWDAVPLEIHMILEGEGEVEGSVTYSDAACTRCGVRWLEG